MVSTYTLVSKELYGTNLFLIQRDDRVVKTNRFISNARDISQEYSQRSGSSQSAQLSSNSNVRADNHPFNGTSLTVTYNCRSGHINGINEHSNDPNNETKHIIDCHGNNQILRFKKIRFGFVLVY